MLEGQKIENSHSDIIALTLKKAIKRSNMDVAAEKAAIRIAAENYSSIFP